MKRLFLIFALAFSLLTVGLTSQPAEATASRVYHTHQTFVCLSGGSLYLRVDYHDPYGNLYNRVWYFWGVC